jgi:hypothetical protein
VKKQTFNLEEERLRRREEEEEQLLEARISLTPSELAILSQIQAGVCDEEELIIPSPGAHLAYETLLTLQYRGRVRKEDDYHWAPEYSEP